MCSSQQVVYEDERLLVVAYPEKGEVVVMRWGVKECYFHVEPKGDRGLKIRAGIPLPEHPWTLEEADTRPVVNILGIPEKAG